MEQFLKFWNCGKSHIFIQKMDSLDNFVIGLGFPISLPRDHLPTCFDLASYILYLQRIKPSIAKKGIPQMVSTSLMSLWLEPSLEVGGSPIGMVGVVKKILKNLRNKPKIMNAFTLLWNSWCLIGRELKKRAFIIDRVYGSFEFVFFTSEIAIASFVLFTSVFVAFFSTGKSGLFPSSLLFVLKGFVSNFCVFRRNLYGFFSRRVVSPTINPMD